MPTPNPRLHSWAVQALADLDQEWTQAEHQGDVDTLNRLAEIKSALEDLRDHTAEG